MISVNSDRVRLEAPVLLEDTTDVLEDTIAVLEDTIAVLEDTIAVLEVGAREDEMAVEGDVGGSRVVDGEPIMEKC
jgi:hypothetical protein